MILSRRFLPLFVTQFIGAFCDNVFKTTFVMLSTFGLAQAHGWNPAYAVQLIGGLFILPFVLFSGWAGYVSDIWARHLFVRRLKIFEAFVMLGAAVSLYTQDFYGMWAVIVALGFISALFGPLKYGLLPVYLEEKELIAGNAWFEGGSFIAIVTGMLVGGLAGKSGHNLSITALVLLALSVVGCASAFFLPAAPAAAAQTISPWGIRPLGRCTADALRTVYRLPVLWRSILGISWFWGFGAVLLNFLPTYAKDILHCDEAGVTKFLLCFAIGVGGGSFLGMALTRGKIRATYVPLAGLALSAFVFLWIVADIRNFVRPQLQLPQQALERPPAGFPLLAFRFIEDENRLEIALDPQCLDLAALAGRVPLGQQGQTVASVEAVEQFDRPREGNELGDVLAIVTHHVDQPGLGRQPSALQPAVECVATHPRLE